ncbi:uncharacterized protein LOC141598154 [Silene latifolia]|uniref:uncharacterized protein LOC141598154 n=1 Tax=Silene latifolia TaxID=37657 RepID=UPI003D773905
MNWYTWLSKTRLDPSLVHEYGLSFTNNELEEEDITYFNHEFLQSMGISIAKHRLEILKLANKEHKTHVLKHPMAKLLFVLKKTKKKLVSYITTLVHHRNNNDRGLILVPKKTKTKTKTKKINEKIISKGGVISYSSRWKKAMMMRNNNRKMVMVNGNNNNNYYSQERLMLTNGDYLGDDSLIYDVKKTMEEKFPDYDDDHDDNDGNVDNKEDDDPYWSPDLEEIKWDAMFHDLKPT